MNLHKLYLGSFFVFLIVAVISAAAWREHVRDDTQRDAVLHTQNSDIAGLQQHITEERQQTESALAALEREKQALAASPNRAPQVIRELIPLQTPIAQPPASSTAVPDAPAVTLSRAQEVDLAQYAVGCKQCELTRADLAQENKEQQEIIARQKTELETAMRAAKGGSVWQRTKRIAKWGAVFGALGYIAGRAQR